MQVFFCEFCEIFKNPFFTEHLWTTASLTKAEVLCSGFLIVCSPILATSEHTGRFKELFPESKIVVKYKCGLTKTSHVLAGAIAKNNKTGLSKSSNDQLLMQTIMSQITTFQFLKNMKVQIDQLKP